MDGSGGVNRLFCFGLGFSAQTLAERLAAKGWQIAGTARDVGKIGHLAEHGYEIAQYSGEAGNSALPKVLHGTTHLLHSIPPGPEGDPVLEHYREEIAKLSFARMDRLSLDRRRLRPSGGPLGRRDHRAEAQQRAHRGAGRRPSGPGSNSAGKPASRCRFSGSPASMVPAAACSTS